MTCAPVVVIEVAFHCLVMTHVRLMCAFVLMERTGVLVSFEVVDPSHEMVVLMEGTCVSVSFEVDGPCREMLMGVSMKPSVLFDVPSIELSDALQLRCPTRHYHSRDKCFQLRSYEVSRDRWLCVRESPQQQQVDFVCFFVLERDISCWK